MTLPFGCGFSITSWRAMRTSLRVLCLHSVHMLGETRSPVALSGLRKVPIPWLIGSVHRL